MAAASCERYKECRDRAKRVVRDAQLRADERWGRKLTEDVHGNKRMFWKEVKTGRGQSSRMEVVKAADGKMMVEQDEVGKKVG